ncbi:MAG: hypothetical protein IKU24_00170 [Clostridia bacterium]|nr:hypothetical protein [Clostridia bacterium]
MFFLIFFFLSFTVGAGATQESIQDFSESDSLWELIPEEADPEGILNLFEKRNGEGFTSSLFQTIIGFFSLGISNGFQMFCTLCGLILVSALYKNIKVSFHLQGMESAFDFLLFLGVAVTAFYHLKGGIDLVISSISSVHSFFIASLPITTILMTMMGAGGSAATLSSSINFVFGLVSAVIDQYLVPLMNTLFCFSMIDGVSDCALGGLISFVKKSVKIICVLFFTLVSAILSLQNVLASAADSLAMRSVRFAAGNFIPVVGSLVGENAKTLSASFQVVKSECGVLCLLVLLFIILKPILFIVVQKTFLSFAGMIGEILGESKCKGLFTSLSSLLDILMALMISEGCYLIFYITLFLNHRGSF